MTDPDKRRRILLIEDSEVDRLWLRHSLASDQIEIAEACDGLSGLECCQKNPPDLILLDLGLPFCDGFEILRRLQEDRRSASIPVIVVSATANPQEKVRGLDLGAVDYVTKPYDLIELQARIRVALRSKRLRNSWNSAPTSTASPAWPIAWPWRNASPPNGRFTCGTAAHSRC